jgi:putative membrane protein insertion efficiency factor
MKQVITALFLPVRTLVIVVLKIYQTCVSPLLGERCRFHPSCSHYAVAAVEKHGIIRGFFFTIRRLFRCHPWHSGGEDPIP